MLDSNIAISGVGVICAAGNNIKECLDNLERGHRNAGPISLFNTTINYPVFEVKNLTINNKNGQMRTLNLALCALQEALDDAELHNDFNNLRVGVCLGTTVASQLNDLDFYASYRNTGSAPMNAVNRFLKGNLAEAVSKFINAKGPCCTITNACSSGTDAIGVALSWLRNNKCDIAIAGGADELSRIPVCGFSALGIMSNSLCAPFDRDRQGLNLGEGAGILVLEPETLARKRGKTPKLFLNGYGSSADAYHLVTPHPDGIGLENALHKAINEAKITSKDICFINAHGTATHDNDKVEGTVFHRVFGQNILFYSTKGFTGHTLGAAGGIEAVFTAVALREKWIPGSAGFINKDSEIPITPVTRKTIINGNYAISTSLGFGGNNSALVFSTNRN